MHAAAAIKAVELLEKDGRSMVADLQEICKKFHKALTVLPDKVSLSGDEISPIKHLRLTYQSGSYYHDEHILRQVIKKVRLKIKFLFF